MDARYLSVKAPEETYGSPLAWFSFIATITMLMAFDVSCFHPPTSSGRMSFPTAVKLTGIWFAMGLVFDIFLLCSLGWNASLGFFYGFMLEYMLSFDNLFVFHLVFAYYCTPEHLIYRALYFGIAGAVVLRMAFLLIGGTLFGLDYFFVKFFFGVVLIWSGIKSARDEDEDTSDPTNNPFVAWVTKHFPVSDNYEPNGQFFVTVSEEDMHNADEDSLGSSAVNSEAGPTFPRLESFEGSSLLEPQHRSASRLIAADEEVRWPAGRGDSNEFEVTRPRGRLRRKASLLLLVVIAVWIVDLVFAVDSVASKLAVVHDIFLNCASSAFAMMSLRSLYFVMESLVEMFEMLKYGIAAILVLLGLKLILSKIVTVSSPVCFAVLMAICVTSIASSYWVERLRDNCEHIETIRNRTTLSPIEEEDAEMQRSAGYIDDTGTALVSETRPTWQHEELVRDCGSASPGGHHVPPLTPPVMVKAAE